jgi:hypothetical protein
MSGERLRLEVVQGHTSVMLGMGPEVDDIMYSTTQTLKLKKEKDQPTIGF